THSWPVTASSVAGLLLADNLQIEGHRAKAMMRGRPCPLQRGHCTSRSATRMDASGSRGLTRRSKSITVPQLSQLITTQSSFAVSAEASLGQNHALPLAEIVALKRRTVANASRCASHLRCIRVMLSPISSLRAL